MNRFFVLCAFLAIIWGCAGAQYTDRVSNNILKSDNLETSTRVLAQAEEWRNSGVIVENGKKYLIKATGRWRIGPTCNFTGPDGIGAYTGPLCFNIGGLAVPGYTGSTLIARIGTQGLPFAVGNELNLDAKEDGVLHFRINDIPGLFWDNEGFVDVKIFLAEKPPVASATLKEPVAKPGSALSREEQAKRLYNEGNAYFEAKSYREAVESYKKALEFESQFPPLYYNLAMAQRELGQKSEAVANFKRYLELRPNAQNASEVKRLIQSLEE